MRSIELTFINEPKAILEELRGNFPAGEIDDKGFSVKTGKDQFDYSIIDFFGAFHVVLFEGVLGETTHIHVKPNDKKSLVIRFVLESNVLYEESDQYIGEGLENGASLFNTYSPQFIKLEKEKKIKWLAIHIPIDKWLDFTNSRWKALNEIIENNKPWILFETMTPQFSKILKDIFALNQTDLGRKALIVSKSIEIVTLFLMQLQNRSQDEESLGIPDMDLNKLFAIRELLNQSITDPPDMPTLSKTFAMSEAKLRSNFKKVFGMPPYQYVLRERLNEAHRLLTSTDRSLTDIGLSMGFNDQSHFTKSFKSTFDYLPSSLRS